MNFIEAALLIQGSACIYSKKVEYLYSLVYQALDFISNKKRDKQPTSMGEDGTDTDVSAGPRTEEEEFFIGLEVHVLKNRMEPVLDKATIIRPSYISSIELSPRKWPVNVEDLKADLSDEFSLVSSDLDISQRNSLDSKEHIQVCLRIRPFTASEKENESQDCVSIQDSTSIILKGPKNSMICQLSEKNVGQMVQKFTFSRVFGPETTQEEFFDGTVKQPVQDFLEGHNRLIFTYGVTNAGKTYTFQGTINIFLNHEITKI
ncbi:hypothetical protein KIL84_004994, partial [Mauremys mutica]